MESFFKSKDCISERMVDIANKQYYIRKIHNVKTEKEDESFEYYLLSTTRQMLASYHAKLEKTNNNKYVLHLYNGFVSDPEVHERINGYDVMIKRVIKNTKEDMKKISILLMDSFEDLDYVALNGDIVVDKKEGEKHYSRFQHACMRFDEECLTKMLYHIGKGDTTQEDIVIKKQKVSKWYHLNGVNNQKGETELGE